MIDFCEVVKEQLCDIPIQIKCLLIMICNFMNAIYLRLYSLFTQGTLVYY